MVSLRAVVLSLTTVTSWFRSSATFFSDSFWEEVSELDELGKRAYTNYLSARDALFACYGASDAPHLQELWRG